jgi:hypothetical protein
MGVVLPFNVTELNNTWIAYVLGLCYIESNNYYIESRFTISSPEVEAYSPCAPVVGTLL